MIRKEESLVKYFGYSKGINHTDAFVITTVSNLVRCCQVAEKYAYNNSNWSKLVQLLADLKKFVTAMQAGEATNAGEQRNAGEQARQEGGGFKKKKTKAAKNKKTSTSAKKKSPPRKKKSPPKK